MTARARLMEKAVKQGPCLLCGSGYARHRLWDSIDASLRAGTSVAKTADEFGATYREVLDVKLCFAAARKAKKPLPGRAPADTEGHQ